jgi:hypothetical protein
MYDFSTAEVFCRYDIRPKHMALPDMHSSVLQSTGFLRLVFGKMFGNQRRYF